MIRPGRFQPPDDEDYSLYVNSIAAEIESELNVLLELDGLPPLSDAPDDMEVRSRRRLFVAIARGIVRHLSEQTGAITVTRADGSETHPTFDIEGL